MFRQFATSLSGSNGRGRTLGSKLGWVGFSQGYRVAAQLLTVLVLSRFLAPDDFGLLAMAAAAIALVTLLRDVGAASYLVHRRELTVAAVNTVFWFNIGLGIALMLLTIAMAKPLASYFRDQRLEVVITTLSVSFPLQGFCGTHQALCERAMRFRFLASLEVVSCTAAAIGATVLAVVYNAGVYSLVAQTLSMLALMAIGLWIRSGWVPARVFDIKELKRSLRYGGNLAAFTLSNYIARNCDALVIGRFLGAQQLGVYSLAYKVMLFPIQNMTWVLNRALMPRYSRLQDDLPTIANTYSTVTLAIAVVAAPLMMFVWVLREAFVALIFGDAWAEVAPLLVYLAPIGFLQSIYSTVGSVYMALGRTDLMFWRSVWCSALIVAGVGVGLPWGLEGIAAGYLVANFAVFLVWCKGISSVLPIDTGSLALRLSGILSIAFVASLSVFWVAAITAAAGWSSGVSALVAATAGGILYGGLLVMFASAVVVDTWQLAKSPTP